MQFFGQAKQPPAILYLTAMNRPDSALALSLMYGYEAKREGRVGAIAIGGSGLQAATFCDLVVHFYSGKSMPNSNRFLPIGFDADSPAAGRIDGPMVKAPVERKNDKGEFVYPRGLTKVSDSAEVSALLRNAVTGLQDHTSTLVLSGPASRLAGALSLPGVRESFAVKFTTLIVVDAAPISDLEAVLAAWPTPVILCPRELGEMLRFPGAAIEKDFAWTPDHPVAEAYRAFQTMPYDAPGWDLAAVYYALHPDAGFFELSEPGTIQVRPDGRLEMRPAADGKHRTLRLKDGMKDKLIPVWIEVASAKPTVREPFRRRPDADAATSAKKDTPPPVKKQP